MNHYDKETHFRKFAASLEAAIARFEIPDGADFLKLQKRQVEKLVALERQFRRVLCNHHMGDKVYLAFVRYINVEKGNILAARPFFRERQKVFTSKISEALRQGKISELKRFNFNFNFVRFVLGSFDWRPRSKIVILARKIWETRNELATMNMPLAISRARIFYSRTPKAQLEYMDLVQISCEGLLSGIDKFVLPFSKVFRSVAIGRIVGNFIEANSETLVHFYPVDKRKLYRVNKLLSRGEQDLEILAEKVNEGVDPGARTTPSELAGLLAAQSYVSTDHTVQEGDDELVRVVDRFAAPLDCQPDVICERMDTYRALDVAISNLNCLEQKLLRLKGVTLG